MEAVATPINDHYFMEIIKLRPCPTVTFYDISPSVPVENSEDDRDMD